MCVFISIFALLDADAANDNTIRVFIDSEEVYFSESDGMSFLDNNGRTQVPLRKTMETAGIIVSYESSERSILLSNGEIDIILIIDSPLINVGESVFRLDTVPVILQNRTYVPLRFIFEQFGYAVEWNETERSVRITQIEDGSPGWSDPEPSFGPHGHTTILGFESIFLSTTEISETELLDNLQGNSVDLKNNSDESITIDAPVSIIYEICKLGSNGDDELMCRFIVNPFIGELPDYSIIFYNIPYSGWKVTKGQYRVTVTATAPFVYYFDGETISNSLEEMARYNVVEKLITIK
jgi:hypothetical protein